MYIFCINKEQKDCGMFKTFSQLAAFTGLHRHTIRKKLKDAKYYEDNTFIICKDVEYQPLKRGFTH